MGRVAVTLVRLFLLCCTLFGLLLGTPAAHAHAMLEQSEPADGAVVAQAPASIVLRFNEPVQVIAARVLDGAGRNAGKAAVGAVRDGEVRLSLGATLATGAYLVSYRVLSADAHIVGGAFAFAVGDNAAAWTLAPRADDMHDVWHQAAIVNRGLHLAALLMLLGGVLHLLFVTGNTPATRRALGHSLRGLPLPGALTALTAVGLQVILMGGDGWHGLFDASLWHLALTSTRAIASAAALLALVLLAIGLRARRAVRVWLMAGLASGLASFVLSGHIAAAEAAARWAMLGAGLLHAAMAAFWIGSLPAVGTAARQRQARPVQRFGRLAPWAVAVLLLAGAILAIVQVRHVAALLDTTYGQLLDVKLALVLLMLLLAAYNRRVLTPGLVNGRAASARRLATVVRIELWIGMTIVAMAAALSQQEPPRVQADARISAPVEHRVVDAAGRSADIVITPDGRQGHVLEVRMRDARGQPLRAIEVNAEFASPAADVEALSRTLLPGEPGVYRYGGPDLIRPGRWNVRVEAVVSAFELAVFRTEVEVGGGGGSARAR